MGLIIFPIIFRPSGASFSSVSIPLDMSSFAFSFWVSCDDDFDFDLEKGFMDFTFSVAFWRKDFFSWSFGLVPR